MTTRLQGDVCIIGCGPAGITLARELVAAGASVVVLESGGLEEDPQAQALLDGEASGPVLKGYATYLRDSRRAQVGGAAARWGRGPRGWFVPLAPIDLERRSWVESSGWPLAAAELEPFAGRAAALLEIAPFERPATRGRLVSHSYHFSANPGAIHDRFGEVRAAPGCRLELGTTAVALVAGDGRVEGVDAVGPGGHRLAVTARATVLAGGAIENTRLLLLADREGSVQLEAPDAVGRHFMEHFHVLAGTVTLPDAGAWRECLGPHDDPALGHPRMSVLALADDVQRRERLLNATVQLAPPAVTTAPADGSRLECDLVVRAEQAPNPDSRVVLGTGADRLGRPAAALQWQPLAQDWQSVVRTAALVAGELEETHGAKARLAIRADAPWPWPPAGPADAQRPTWGNHHIGTTRMDRDGDVAVVDRDCGVGGTANLFVAGSAVFTTSGFANPTFTIVALAIRLGDHLRTAIAS